MSGKSWVFEVYFSARAVRQLKALDSNEQRRIKEAVKKLEVFPSITDVEKIKTRPGEYRLRAGNWRIFFRYLFVEKQVEIISIRPREKAYD